MLRAIIDEDEREHFVCIMLDGQSKPTGYQVVSVGTINSSLVHPREVFAPAMVCHAASILIGHNHPSGDPRPSHEDREVTLRLREAGRILGIELVDHVIVGNGSDSYFSFRENGGLV